MATTALPLDIRLMDFISRALLGLFGLVALALGASWLAQQPVWAVQGLRVVGDVGQQNPVALRAHLALHLQDQASAGSFLSADLGHIQTVLERAPWVRKAVVQREFPNRLRLTLEEHRAVAWWGQAQSGQLVNDLGEVFEASADDAQSMPVLAGPTEQSVTLWALYQDLARTLEPLGMGLAQLTINERGSWQAQLDNGAQLAFGRGSRDEVMARMVRFTETLQQVTSRYPGAIRSVDLRYPNGYAMQLRGVTTLQDGAALSNPNTR